MKRVWQEVKRVHTDLGMFNVSRNNLSLMTQELNRTYVETERMTSTISKLYTEIDKKDKELMKLKAKVNQKPV